jgi:hypothetical protein
VPSSSHLTSCTSTKSNLNVDSSFTAVMSEPALYRILSSKSHVHFPQLRSFFHRIRPNPRPCVTFRKKLIFLRWVVVNPTLNPQSRELPLIGCPRLLSQCIRSYPPYLEAVFSISNPRTRLTVVTRVPLNVGMDTNKMFYHVLWFGSSLEHHKFLYFCSTRK